MLTPDFEQVFYKFYFVISKHNVIDCVKSFQIRSFFQSVFSCIRIEQGNLRSKYPDTVRIQENTDQKKLRTWTFFTQRYFYRTASWYILIELFDYNHIVSQIYCKTFENSLGICLGILGVLVGITSVEKKSCSVES